MFGGMDDDDMGMGGLGGMFGGKGMGGPGGPRVIFRNGGGQSPKALKIVSWDDSKGRYEVEVDAGDTTLSLKPQNITQTCSVRIVGIESKPELNGKSGQLLSFDKGQNRYTVRLNEKLEGGKDVLGLQPSNVILPKGTRVVVANLGKEEFNGQMAQINEVDESAQRSLA
eukprot:g6907.t1